MNLPEFHTQHVFIIDEHVSNHQLFQQVIGELPYLVHVSITDNADEGIKTLKEQPELPDLLFLDLEMSSKDGLQCLREIKADEKLAALPVMIFSSTSYPAVINDAYEAGAHLYIPNSHVIIDFKKSIEHVLSINWKEKISRPPREEFVMTVQ